MTPKVIFEINGLTDGNITPKIEILKNAPAIIHYSIVQPNFNKINETKYS